MNTPDFVRLDYAYIAKFVSTLSGQKAQHTMYVRHTWTIKFSNGTYPNYVIRLSRSPIYLCVITARPHWQQWQFVALPAKLSPRQSERGLRKLLRAVRNPERGVVVGLMHNNVDLISETQEDRENCKFVVFNHSLQFGLTTILIEKLLNIYKWFIFPETRIIDLLNFAADSIYYRSFLQTFMAGSEKRIFSAV